MYSVEEYPRLVIAKTSTPSGRYSWAVLSEPKTVVATSKGFFKEEAECLADVIQSGNGHYPIYGM